MTHIQYIYCDKDFLILLLTGWCEYFMKNFVLFVNK